VLGSAGAGYDATTNTLYLVGYDDDAVFTVDRDTAVATPLGGLMGIDAYDAGGEFFNDQLFVAVQNGTTNRVEVGTIDLSDGAYSSLLPIAVGANFVATSLVVVPEPSVLVLFGLGFASARRRR
jgi:hypothetical protein